MNKLKIFSKIIINKEIMFLLISYFFLRLINLIAIPIFNDEAIYLDWGWRQVHFPGSLYYSLYDGKQPFLMWVFGLFETFFKDPLFAGRLVSVISGFFTMLGLYFIGKDFFNKKVAFFASFLYIVIPIFSFFDRQALMESFIASAGVWMIYFLIKILENYKLKYAYFLGIISGLGIFTKSTVVIFLVSIAFLSVYFLIKNKSDNKMIISKGLLKAFIISQVILSLLYINGRFWSTLSMNSRYSLTLSELLHFPILKWVANISNYFEISFWYLTPFILIISFIGFLKIKKTHNWKGKYIIYYFLINFILLIFLTRNISPRYIVSFLPLITIFASYFIFEFKRINNVITLIILAAIPVLVTTIQVFSPLSYFNILNKATKFSQKDEYIKSWTSGYGIKEVNKFLMDNSRNSSIIVGVRVDAGIPESAMLAYSYKNSNIKGLYFDSKLLGLELLKYDCLKTSSPTFFISRGNQLAGLEKFIYEKKRFYKPEGKEYIGIFSLINNCKGKTYDLKIN